MDKIFNLKLQKSLRQKLRNERPVSEKLLWHQLQGSKIGYKFRRQQGIGRYVVDFYCPELKIVVEIDGATHGTEEELKQDKAKEDFLKNLGLRVKRYLNVEVKNGLGGVMDDLKDFISSLEKK